VTKAAKLKNNQVMPVIMRDGIKNETEYYSQARSEMLKFLPDDIERVLEIGCAEGNFGCLVKKIKGIEVWGVEISEEAAQKAMGKLDHVLIGSIENDELDIPLNYFECIVFNDVLEHLAYPWFVLEDMKKYLKGDGYVVASVPNVRYFHNVKNLILNEDWEYEDKGILDKTHLRFFTVKSLRRMMEKCNYKVIAIEEINSMGMSWKYNLLNILFMQKIKNMRYMQIGCLAKLELE
jgi:SAM-dependent methyltransferase